jgi:hypothetical protein
MSDWIPLDKACEQIGYRSLGTILGRGRVQVIAKRDDRPYDEPPDRVESLLAETAVQYPSAVQILGDRIAVWDSATYSYASHRIMLSEVRVHWPQLASELEAAGLNIDSTPAPLQDCEHRAPNRVYYTGAAGRPSSWNNLIEPECRRRYKEGERHSNDHTEIESPAKWAGELLSWLIAKHPNAPPPTMKTLGNHLSPLLRELAAESRLK